MIYVVLIMLMALLFIGGYYILTKMKSKVVEKGKELEKEGKLEEAVNEYEKALSNESDEEVLWRLANVHEKMGKINPAIFRLKEIVKRRMYTDDVTEYKVLIKLGILLFKKNKDEESFETFLKLYKGHKQDPLILQYLIVISLGQRRCDVASALLKDLLKVDDSEPNTFFLLGICFYEREEYNQAKLMFEEASRRSETDDWRYKYLEGISLFMMKNYVKSLDCLLDLMGDKISHPRLVLNLYQIISRCHLNMKQYDKACLALEEGSLNTVKDEIEKGYQDLDEDLFAIAIHLNDPDKAKQALQNLIDIEPSSFRWNTLMDTLTEILSLHEKAMKEYNEKIKAKTKEDMRLSLDQLLNEKKSSEENEPANQEPMPELDLNTSFSGFIEYWSKKDILEDTVWQLSNLSRGESFDISKYLDSLERKQEGKSEANVEVIPELANHFKSLARKEFLDKNRKILNKLKFDVSKEEYGSEEVFLSQGDGADYIATLKGSDKKDRYIIQVRRWQSKNIGELVMKELSSQVADKRAKQGIFITTGELSKDALNYVEKSQNINVIQGKQLDLLLNGIIVPK